MALLYRSDEMYLKIEILKMDIINLFSEDIELDDINFSFLAFSNDDTQDDITNKKMFQDLFLNFILIQNYAFKQTNPGLLKDLLNKFFNDTSYIPYHFSNVTTEDINFLITLNQNYNDKESLKQFISNNYSFLSVFTTEQLNELFIRFIFSCIAELLTRISELEYEDLLEIKESLNAFYKDVNYLLDLKIQMNIQ